MANILNLLADNKGARYKSKRLGRGIGSGKGKTCGRGGKGQTARSGVAINGFEGGQMPIYRRLPKRGFHNYNRKELEGVNLLMLQKLIDRKEIDASKPITTAVLVAVGLAAGDKDGIKLLAKGEIKSKVTIEVDAASVSAIAAVEKSGGKVSIVEKKVAASGEKKAKKTSTSK